MERHGEEQLADRNSATENYLAPRPVAERRQKCSETTSIAGFALIYKLIRMHYYYSTKKKTKGFQTFCTGILNSQKKKIEDARICNERE